MVFILDVLWCFHWMVYGIYIGRIMAGTRQIADVALGGIHGRHEPDRFGCLIHDNRAQRARPDFGWGWRIHYMENFNWSKNVSLSSGMLSFCTRACGVWEIGVEDCGVQFLGLRVEGLRFEV